MLINENLQLATLDLPTQTGGNLGSAATTVDITSHIRITQTTGTPATPVTIGLFSPTNSVVGQIIHLSSHSTSTGYFAIGGVTVNPGSFITLVFGTTWQLQSPTPFPNSIDINGTLTTRQGVPTISNSLSTRAITGVQVDSSSYIKIIQTITDATITIANPVTSTAGGRFLRLHNDNTSTFNLIFGNAVALPGQYFDLQWNGNVWAVQTNTSNTPNSITRVYNLTDPAVLIPTALGEFEFMYSQNTPGGHLLIRSSSPTVTRQFQYVAQRKTNVLPIAADFIGSAGSLLTAQLNSGSMLPLNFGASSLNYGTSLSYRIWSQTNTYDVDMTIFNNGQ